MRTLLLFILFFSCTCISTSQDLVCSEADQDIFENKISQLIKLDETEMGTTIVSVGKTFVGSPYVAQTLEIRQKESLIVNLREFDCTTYVENVMAFSLLVTKEEESIDAFTSVLQNIRYRDGELKGYPSRLHYFTDWIADNQKKGLVKDITLEIGGVEIEKEINFMSNHRESYPMLKSDSSLEEIESTERVLSGHKLNYIPREKVADVEHLIQDGDIIALATSIKGLDVTHTGFAIRVNDDRIHLLHASSSGKVEVSEKPLADYLLAIKSNIGIVVARPQ